MLEIRIGRYNNTPTYKGRLLTIESDLGMGLDTNHLSNGGSFYLHRLSLQELEYIVKTINDYLKEAK